MRLPEREEVAIKCLATNNVLDLFLIGTFLILVACSNKGETVQESIDVYRKLRDTTKFIDENLIRENWDQLRTWTQP